MGVLNRDFKWRFEISFCKCILVEDFKGDYCTGILYGDFKWGYEGYIDWGIEKGFCMGIL